MNSDEVIGSVRLSFAVGLKPWNADPTAYLFPAKGDIIVSRDDPSDPDAIEIAGQIEIKVIMFSEAFNDHIDLADVFHEANLDEVHSAFFNRKGDFKKRLDIALLPGAIIFINAITLESKYRRTRLLLQSVESLIPALSSMGLVVARRATLDRGNTEWKQLAFDPVPGTDFVYREDFEIDPRRKAY
jgi:hypothetical protein